MAAYPGVRGRVATLLLWGRLPRASRWRGERHRRARLSAAVWASFAPRRRNPGAAVGEEIPGIEMPRWKLRK